MSGGSDKDAVERSETILVIEDDRSLREGLALNFKLRGYQVHTALDGEDTLPFASFLVRVDNTDDADVQAEGLGIGLAQAALDDAADSAAMADDTETDGCHVVSSCAP